MKNIFIFALLVLTGTCIAFAVNGKAETDVKSETQEVYDCKHCQGTGYGNMTQACPSCKGEKKTYTSEWCKPCSGSGLVTDRYGDKVTCPTCKGERMKITIETCKTCQGRGYVPMKCMTCKGSGKVPR